MQEQPSSVHPAVPQVSQGSQIASQGESSAAPSAEARYSDRVQCSSCHGSGTTGEHGCTDCLGKGLDHMAFVGGIEGALNDAYAEGRKDEREEWQSVLDALEIARNGLQWYRDTYHECDSGADDEAMKQIDAAIAKAEARA